MRKVGMLVLAMGLVAVPTGQADAAEAGCFSECRRERTEVMCRMQTTDGQAPEFWYWSRGAGI